MKNHFISLLLAMIELIASAGIGSAADVIVDSGTSIQAAIDNSTAGDCIIVEPGTYNENLEINDKSLTLKSESGCSNTIINGNIHTSTYANVVIDGFTFKGSGSGITADCAAYTVKNCKLIQCGTGVSIGDGGDITVTNNEFVKCNNGILGMPFSHITAENNRFIDCDQMMFDPQYQNTVDLKDNNETHTGGSGSEAATPASSKDSKSVTPAKTQEVTTQTSTNKTATPASNEDSKSVTSSETQEVMTQTSTNKTATPASNEDSKSVTSSETQEVMTQTSTNKTATPASNEDSKSVTPAETQEVTTQTSTNKNASNEDSKSVTSSETQEVTAETSANDVAPTEPTSTNTPSGVSSDISSNVLAKDVAQATVISGDKTTFSFTNNTACVESITFVSDETMDEILAIVEELKNKLDSIPDLPEGEVYKYFNIYVGTDNLNSIRNASINFSVNDSWIQENNINQSSIALDEYNNTSEEWEKLPVNITGNDSQALHFTADVPNYSSFAITANQSNETSVAVNA